MEVNKSQIVHEKRYDIVIVGGGPSTISFLSYIIKNNKEQIFSNTSILIVDKTENFGSGCLGKYGINSNTSGEGFLRLLSYPEEKNESKLNLSPNKKISQDKNLSSERNNIKINSKKEVFNGKYMPLPIFQEFYNCSAVQTLLSYGSRPAPLSLIGLFFDCLGNFILEYIFKHYKKNIFQSKTEVLSVKIMSNDEFSISLKNSNNIEFQIKARVLILANGGKPSVNSKYVKEINKVININDFYTSDYVLQEHGYKKLINNLKSKKDKKVFIVGGGHSGFSIAWILLHGPANYKLFGKDYCGKKNICQNCANCNFNCCSELQNINKNEEEQISIKTTKISTNAVLSNNNQNTLNKFCTNDCFGKVNDKQWMCDQTDTKENLNKDPKSKYYTDKEREKLEITILYRKQIRVYYHTEDEARIDDYTDYEKTKAVNKSGNVYPFIGIRGDGKELYRNIIKGKEKKVKLIQSENWESQKNFLTSGNILIWACGYETNNILFKDFRNTQIEFKNSDEGNTCEVDKELRIIDKLKNPIKNLFGIGQGYSTFSTEIVDGKKAKADAVNLYNTHIAKKLFKSIDSVFSNIKHSESNNNHHKINFGNEPLSSGSLNNILKNTKNDKPINVVLNLNMKERYQNNLNSNIIKNPIGENNSKMILNNNVSHQNKEQYNLKNSYIIKQSERIKLDSKSKFLNNSSSYLNINQPNTNNKPLKDANSNNISNNISNYDFYKQKIPEKPNILAKSLKLNENIYTSYYQHLNKPEKNQQVNNALVNEYNANQNNRLGVGKFSFLPKKSSITALNYQKKYNNKENHNDFGKRDLKEKLSPSKTKIEILNYNGTPNNIFISKKQSFDKKTFSNKIF